MVLFDATMLSLLFHPGAKAPTDADSKPIPRARERVEHLVETLEKSKTKIIIPTPALAELLVLAGAAGPKYIEEIEDKAFFKVSDFDKRAAIEVSLQIREAMGSGNKKAGSVSTWAKVKFDRQIVAIAKVEGVTTIYSDDKDLTNRGFRGFESRRLVPSR
jgi:predicted nucleic acid-binding protein